MTPTPEIEALRKKLFFHKAKSFLIVDAPDEYLPTLEGIPYDTEVMGENRGTYDYIQVFVKRKKDLVSALKELSGMGKRDCLLWISYPKLTSSLAGDLKRETVWHVLRTVGLDAVAQVAIDDTWSALCARSQKSKVLRP